MIPRYARLSRLIQLYSTLHSAFFENQRPGIQAQKTELEQLLITQGVSDVYVCGIAADICVGESWHNSIVCYLFGVGYPTSICAIT